MGFEFGVAYGGSGGYSAGDCQLNSKGLSNDGCDGVYHNLDFYTKGPEVADDEGDPDCGSDGFCKICPYLAEAHDSCRDYSSESFSQDAEGTITTSFKAWVDETPGGCCQANSCVGAYFESKIASMRAGDKVYFDYQAFAGDDWFEVAIGLYDDMNHLEQCKVYRGNAMDDYTNDYFDIPLSANYKLGFFAGSYDRTGGMQLGATLKVKAFQMTVPMATSGQHGASQSQVAMAAVDASRAATEESAPLASDSPSVTSWSIVAILRGAKPASASAYGDLSSCPDSNCKLSDAAINAAGFTLLKFEPKSPSATEPITYFDMSGRNFDSTAPVEPCSTPWTLSESNALSGVCCACGLNRIA